MSIQEEARERLLIDKNLEKLYRVAGLCYEIRTLLGDFKDTKAFGAFLAFGITLGDFIDTLYDCQQSDSEDRLLGIDTVNAIGFEWLSPETEDKLKELDARINLDNEIQEVLRDCKGAVGAFPLDLEAEEEEK